MWPISVTPYELHLVSLGGEGMEAQQVANDLYSSLESGRVEVLYDDREASPGVKFADADLIGLPLRVTVSARSLE
ncbi:MAG: His/Gly/Thr/Pro-type tRNA ligase C-terminal domain-containing protein [Chloroflexota bacterium]|nr:His/Gly/Thr/Pro-type tRNA ligase C-terminal domain-containing protein [Chloroflexota bacterium]